VDWWLWVTSQAVSRRQSGATLTLVQIADLESGRAVPNQQLLAKLERIVGVKLRGAPALIGTPLAGPKKK
jgi:ribosome-binding protein aMBF1 (putative translation factor)